MKRPVESEYTSQVAYTRALEAYCDSLAQPEQEPVARVAEVHMSRYTLEWTNGPLPEGTELFAAAQPPLPVQETFGYWFADTDLEALSKGWFVKGPSDGKLNGVAGIALYTTPPLPEQEPWMYRLWNDKDAQWQLTDDCSWPAEPIYTTPPKRPWGKPWVSLTYEEISVLSKGHMTRNGFARNVLAKSKEKNT